jgi:VIT1/CCC1 family predicted Fe2+/Mn2+ transporter
VAIALAVTGAVSARLGSASIARAVVRLVGGGAAAMAVTFAIGQLAGATMG